MIELTRVTRHIAVLTLDNPPVNTLTWTGREKISLALAEVAADLDVRALVLTGAGRVFTAGADLAEAQRMPAERTGEFLADFDRILHGVEDLRVPVIAAVNGPATGGGLELALACDLRIAARQACFVAAGVNVGLMASTWRLPRVIGLGPAKEMLLTGERCTAEQALGWGLVSEVCEGAELLDRALAKAERIASRVPLSVEATKAGANRALERSRAEAERSQAAEFQRLFRSADHREALRAFFAGEAGEYHRR